MFSSIKLPNALNSRKNNQVLLVDTDVLSDIGKGGKSKKIEQRLLADNFILLYSLTSIMELGFGSNKEASSDEIGFYRDLYLKKTAYQKDLFVTDFSVKLKLGQLNHVRGKWVGVSPDSHNWYASKRALVSYMDDRGTKPRNAKDLQIDALLSCAAWNAGGFIWSNNVKDHLLATYYLGYGHCASKKEKDKNDYSKCLSDFLVPIFDTELLERALNGETYNIFTEMISKTTDQKMKEALAIAGMSIES